VFSQSYKNIEKFKSIVYTLADDSMQGREAGSEGEKKAKKFLVEYYKTIGLKTINGSYIQEFTFPKDSSLIDTAYNLVGYINNNADSTIIIGAHYDHLGLGGPKSRSLTNKKIHPGADDNASGVALMLVLAEQIKKSLNIKFNYVFIAFSAHEDGLYGSKAYVSKKENNLSKIKLMLNFDMVGRLNIAYPILKVTRRAKDMYFDSVLNNITHKNFQLNVSEDSLLESDATAFKNHNIPILTISTGIHDDYHKVSDITGKINFDGMYDILIYFNRFIKSLI